MAKAKILGKLRGVIASAKERSRNGRDYTEGFWDKIFSSDLFLEGLKNRCLVGACYHPDDDKEYEQIHMDPSAAVVLAKVEKKNKEYIGTFDILPTPAGEAVKNLTDVGCVFGVSSRGLSDKEHVLFDENVNDYDLITFDLVAFPGIKSARLHPISVVAESVSTKQNNKKKASEGIKNMLKDKEVSPRLKDFIKETLMKKEGFDTDIQAEEFYDDVLMDEIQKLFDDKDFDMNAVKNLLVLVDADGKIKHVSVEHGIKEVEVPPTMKEMIKPGEIYMGSGLFYDEDKDKYILTGSWLKLK